MRTVTVAVFALVFAASGAAAQTRERAIATFQDGSAKIEIAATNQGEVVLYAVDRFERVTMRSEPAAVRAWVDSTVTEMTVRLQAGPREKVTNEGPWLGSLHWSREVTATSSVDYVYLGDGYGVNSVMLGLTRTRARAFLTAMRDAATQTEAMSPVHPAEAPDYAESGALRVELLPSQTYFSFQVERQAAPIAGSALVPYPAALRTSRVEGEVHVQFVVDTLGVIELPSFKVLRSSNDLFTMAVREAAPGMRFTPAEVNGKKVRQLVQLPFSFTLPSHR